MCGTGQHKTLCRMRVSRDLATPSRCETSSSSTGDDLRRRLIVDHMKWEMGARCANGNVRDDELQRSSDAFH